MLAHQPMARPYSAALRCRILKAYEGGGVSLGELAERYRVSLPYIKKIRRQLLRTGRMERPPERRHGPPRRITPAMAARPAGSACEKLRPPATGVPSRCWEP